MKIMVMLTLDTWNVKAPIKYLDNGTSDISGLLVMKWLKSLYVNVGHATCHQNDSLMINDCDDEFDEDCDDKYED